MRLKEDADIKGLIMICLSLANERCSPFNVVMVMFLSRTITYQHLSCNLVLGIMRGGGGNVVVNAVCLECHAC